ncbi:ScbR family autoregulator-binding transcription factor [Streptomyces sp. NPDC101225]|uniref:ScbR family autoregulator-binding transcription factor n=1 Tax=Streptomyces sp. NPDC101225 TaxID=3366135 RepID=UPI0038126110
MVKQERAARTRENLIRAAAEVFEREGYAVASLTVISSQAGVSNGALHFHFASKEVLAREVEQAAADVVHKLAEGCRAAAGGLLASLVEATARLLAALAEDSLVRAGFRLGHDPSRQGGDGGLWRWWSAWVRDLLVQAQREGELARGVAPADVAAAFVAVTAGVEVLSGLEGGWLSPERAGRFWAFLLPLLAAPGPPPASAPAPASPSSPLPPAAPPSSPAPSPPPASSPAPPAASPSSPPPASSPPAPGAPGRSAPGESGAPGGSGPA